MLQEHNTKKKMEILENTGKIVAYTGKISKQPQLDINKHDGRERA